MKTCKWTFRDLWIMVLWYSCDHLLKTIFHESM